MPSYSDAYAKYVRGEHDLIGIIAYGLYKQAKSQLIRDNQPNGPSPDQLQAFHSNMCLDRTVNAFRADANDIYNKIFQVKLTELAKEREAAFNENIVGQHILAIKNKLDAKRTIKGWVADIGGALLLNVLTIVFIGFLVFGYHELEDSNTMLDKVFHIGEAAGNSPTGGAQGNNSSAPPNQQNQQQHTDQTKGG